MTGGELLIKSGDLWYFTNVANDGYCLQDFATQFLQAAFNNNKSAKDILSDFFNWRSLNYPGDFEVFNADPTNPQDFDKCYFVYSNDPDITNKDYIYECLLDDLVENPSCDDEGHPYFQLACSHCDHHLFIDLDNKTYDCQ
jgi:hypothetical protein